MTEALVVLDAGLRIVSANETFYRDLAQARRPAEGVSLFDLGRGMCDAPALRRALEEILATGAPFTGVELPAALPDGRSRVLSLTGRRLSTTAAGPAEEGQPMVLLAIVDVTDLRRLEAERTKLLESERQSRREAERANRAKDLFLATLSHELRTPLSTMLMWAEYLKRAPTADPTLLNAFAAVERAAKAQAKLIEDLLDVSRIASGKLLLDLGPVDLEAVVRGAVEVARPTALAKSLDLQVAVEGPLGPVYGDAARLQQVAQNLLANAIKFTPRGGRVSVRLERQGDQARLSVSDTGMGIRREVLPRLFGRFVQADSSVTRTHGGLGLGLSIVRHLVEVHGGEVHAESEGEGRGATFTVTLPLGAGPPVAPTPTPVARAIEGTRVLLVEDDDDTREVYAAM
ncbi:MAG: PAS domain-containing protein, partial [Planctomycetota bacterium]|nr:PAS domain-containing protein [Planctomycetota bacterium]